MGILKKVFGNTKKPEGFWGKLMVEGMNRGHAPLADWGMSFFGDTRPKSILDCGCGGGRNVAELLKRYPQAEVTGLDYSEVSVKKSQEVNADAVQNGRCRIVQGGVFVVVNEAGGKNKADEKWTTIIDGMKIYGKEELERYLREAGFTRIETYRSEGKYRLTVRAVK